ncbi:MAG: hypothetical protein R3C61_12740 [Bacteroidia bacterium]
MITFWLQLTNVDFPQKPPTSLHLPAQSLIYTLLISLIVSTLLGGYILVNHYQRILFHRLEAVE